MNQDHYYYCVYFMLSLVLILCIIQHIMSYKSTWIAEDDISQNRCKACKFEPLVDDPNDDVIYVKSLSCPILGSVAGSIVGHLCNVNC